MSTPYIIDFIPDHLDEVMDIWLKGNIAAHDFIDPQRWHDLYDDVTQALPESDLYLYRDEGVIKGFIGITDKDYVAGLFVADGSRSHGIGQSLLDHAKGIYPHLALNVYVANARAVAFYRRNGFSITAQDMNPMLPHEEFRMEWSR